MIALALVVVAATGAGLEARRRLGGRAERIASLLLNVVLWAVFPIVAFFNVASLDLTGQVFAGIAYGWASVAAGGLVAYVVGSRLLALSRPALGALVIVGGFGNTGFLGLPFQTALFGRDALPSAVAYDALVSGALFVTVGFSIAAAFGTVASRPRDRVRAFLARNPPLWATLAGLVAPDALAPQFAVDSSPLLVAAAVPFGFFAVGVTLGGAGARGLPALDRTVLTALGCKVVAAPAVVLALSTVFVAVPGVYLVQPAMASALNSVVVANAYGLDGRVCAAAVSWSTAIVLTVGVAVSLL